MKMQLPRLLAIGALVAALLTPAFGAETEKKKGGPSGGRVIRTVEPPLEFFVTKERKVEIRALTPELQAAKLSGQVVAVTAGDRSKPTKLEFKEEDGRLVSTNALPDGEDLPVSVSIKTNAGAKPVYDKFNLDLDKCPTCKFQEYACICEHAGEKKDAKAK